MARNNELEDFWKTVNKTQLASTELSTQLNDNGIGYKPGTKEDNQDLAAKKALTVSISKKTKQVSGYEVQYATNKKFTKAKTATITWKKVNKATGYKIYRATSKNGKYKRIKTIKNADIMNTAASFLLSILNFLCLSR